MSKYKAIVTTAGAAKIAAASAGGKQLKITHMAVGDGNGVLPTPNPAQTKLINEKYRALLNTLTIDKSIDNHIIAEFIIPANVGGFWLREMGLYDDVGTLIAVSNMAESYKPKLEEGSGRTQTLRMVLIVSSTDAIQIIAGGDTVLATRDFVDDAIKAHEKTRNHPDASTTAKGLVQLSSATTSNDETKAATPKAVKDVNDASAKKAANLSDLTDKAAARGNLALGTAATKNVGVEGGNVMAVGAFGLGVGPQHKDAAFSDVARIYRLSAASTDTPGGSTYGVICLPCDGAPSAAYLAAGLNGELHVGRSSIISNGVAWSRVFTTAYKPTAADINAYTKQEADGRFAFKSITINGKPLSSNVNLTAGDVNAWNKTESDGRFIYKSGDTINWLNVNNGLAVGLDTTVGRTLYINGLDFIMKRGLQDPINNERQTNGMRIQGAGDLFVDLYHHERMGQHHFFGIHVANGGADGWYEFRNEGSFSASSTVGAGGPGGSKLHPDGNISGSMWGGYLRDWLYHNTISRVMRGAQGSMTMDGGLVEAPAGCVLTGGNGNEGNQVGIALYRPLQIWRSGGWVTIEG